jgi:hypothetical protein
MRVARIMKIVKVVKLLRLLKLPTLMRTLEQKLGRAVLRMATFVISALMMIHWSACAFHYAATFSTGTNWVRRLNLATKPAGQR